MAPLLNFWRHVAIAMAILVSFFVAGCEYQTDEKFYAEVPRPDWSDVSIDLASLDSDTIYIYQKTELHFNTLIGDHRIKGAYAHLGDILVHTSSDQLVPIIIETEYIPSGTYKLRLELSLTSGTGSLADFREQELGQIYREWTVIIDREIPSKIEITSIEKVDGRLVIRWNGYKKWNFQHYTLTKHCFSAFYGYYDRCWSREVASQDIDMFIDSSFVGGKVKYSLAVKAANHLSEPDEHEIEFPYDPKLEYKWADNRTLELTWRKPEFYNNLASYTISFPNSQDSRTFSVVDVNDTILQVEANMKFPGYKQLAIVANPKMLNDYNYGTTISHNAAIIGKYFPLFQGEMITYNKTLNKYFTIGYKETQRSLLRIDPVSLEAERSFPCTNGMFALSENGEYLYVADDSKLFRIDPSDFTIISEMDFEINWWASYRYMRVSNNNRLIVENDVWDLNTGTLIQTLSTTTYSISPSGEFIFGFGKLFRYNGTSYQQVTQFGTLPSWGEFTTDNKFLSYGTASIVVFDLLSMTPERSIPSEARYLHLDPATGLIGGFTDDFAEGPKKFYIFSTTGLEKQIDISNISTQYSYLHLLNNNLICSCGHIVPVDWYD